MRYTMTIEQTRRIQVSFNAPDDQSALKKAENTLQTTPEDEFDKGDTEYSYRLIDEDEKVLVEY